MIEDCLPVFIIYSAKMKADFIASQPATALIGYPGISSI